MTLQLAGIWRELIIASLQSFKDTRCSIFVQQAWQLTVWRHRIEAHSVWHAVIAVAICDNEAEDYVWIRQFDRVLPHQKTTFFRHSRIAAKTWQERQLLIVSSRALWETGGSEFAHVEGIAEQ